MVMVGNQEFEEWAAGFENELLGYAAAADAFALQTDHADFVKLGEDCRRYAYHCRKLAQHMGELRGWKPHEVSQRVSDEAYGAVNQLASATDEMRHLCALLRRRVA